MNDTSGLPQHEEAAWAPASKAAHWLNIWRTRILHVAVPLPFIIDLMTYLAGGTKSAGIVHALCAWEMKAHTLFFPFFVPVRWSECIAVDNQKVGPLLVILLKSYVMGLFALISGIMLIALLVVQNPIGKILPGYKIRKNRNKAMFYFFIGVALWIGWIVIPGIIVGYNIRNNTQLTDDASLNVVISCALVWLCYSVAVTPTIMVGMSCLLFGRNTNLPPIA
jgi:hypothetical protein